MGRTGAFAAIFDRYFGKIHRYLARRVGVRAAADRAGEVFLAAFAQRKRYDITRGTAGPWLYGIATNLVGSRVCAAGQREVIRQQITKLIGATPRLHGGPRDNAALAAPRSDAARG